jgi:hypothetical protein
MDTREPLSRALPDAVINPAASYNPSLHCSGRLNVVKIGLPLTGLVALMWTAVTVAFVVYSGAGRKDVSPKRPAEHPRTSAPAGS